MAVAAPTAVPPRSKPEHEDFLEVFAFSLDLSGKAVGFFNEVSGITSENEVITHNATNDDGKGAVRKSPGRLKFGDITLKRGITSSMQLWEWRQEVVDGEMDKCRKTVTITLYNRAFKAVAKWDFYMAWPSKLTGPTFKADGNEFGIEELTIVHEGMYRKE